MDDLDASFIRTAVNSIKGDSYLSFTNKKTALIKMRKLSAHCCVTNPERMGYPYLESIRSFANLCDEVIVVDGGSSDGSLEKIKKIPKVLILRGERWRRDFDWGVMPKNLNIGFDACQYGWRFHFDVDYIFHEDDVQRMREAIAESNMPALEIKKVNFVLADECYKKDNYPLLVNKGEFPVLCYGIGRDNPKAKKSYSFLRPIARTHTREDGLEEGTTIKMSNVRVGRVDIPVYTYDFTFMTKEQVAEQRQRFENSVRRFGRVKSRLSKDTTFRGFLSMMRKRHKECKKIKLEEHSKFIRDKVKNITPEMFGHSFWGLFLEN